MAIKAKEQAIIDLVINGQQARASLRELAGAYNAVWSEASRLRQEEDPVRYAQLQQQVERLGAARDAERDRLRGVTRAIQEQRDENKGFFSDFKKGFAEVSEMAGSITAGTLLYKGISAGLSYIKQVWDGSEQAYKEAEQTQTALQNKLDQTGAAAGRSMKALQGLQQKVMEQTGVDDDIIAKGEDVVLSYQNITGTIYDQLIPAAVNLTSAQNKGIVTMDGMTSSSDILAKILERPANAKKKLMKIGVDLTDQMESEIKTLIRQNKLQDAQQLILDQVNKRYGNLAETLANTETGVLQRYETRIGNIQEVFGKWIVSGKAAMADFFSPLISLVERLTGVVTSAQALTAEYYKQKSAVADLERTTAPLISRYDELKEKGSLNKKEQIELNGIIDTLSSTIPTAVTQWDKYGKALGINTDKARDFIKMQQAMLKIKNKEAIDESESTIESLEARAGRIQGILTYGKKTVIGGRSASDGSMPETKLTADDIADYTKQLQQIKQQVDDLKLGVRGLKGEMIDIPEPNTPPTGGGGPTDDEKAAAERKLEAFKKLLEDTRVQADQLAESARKGTVDDLDAQLKVIENKYKRVVDAINKLIKDPHTTPAIRKELVSRLNTLNADERLEEQNKRDSYAKEQQAKAKKDRDDELKAASSRIDDIYTTGQSDLENAKNNDLNAVTGGDPATVEARRLNIQEAYAQKSFDLEQQHLQDLKGIYEAYGESTASLDKKIADNTIKENDRAAKSKTDRDKAYKAAKEQLQQFEISTAQQGVQFLEGVLDKRSALYKAALIADKAMAIANVIMSTEVAIGKFAASVAYLGPIGAALAAKYAITAHISEGISIASIIASAAAGLKTDKKTAAKGGVFTGKGHDAGGLDVIDPNTGRTVVNVEGGEPWMVLSRETRRNNGQLIEQLLYNSMYRNGARVDVARVAGGIQRARSGAVIQPAAASASAAPSPTPVMFDTSELVEEMRLTRQAIKDQKVLFSMREFHRQNDKLADIDERANA